MQLIFCSIAWILEQFNPDSFHFSPFFPSLISDPEMWTFGGSTCGDIGHGLRCGLRRVFPLNHPNNDIAFCSYRFDKCHVDEIEYNC